MNQNQEHHLHLVDYAKDILTSWPDGLILVNSDLIIESANANIWSMLGWKLEDLSGRNIHEFLCSHACDYVHSSYECPIAKLMNHGKSFECIEAWLVKHNGEFCHLDIKKITSLSGERFIHVLSLKENSADAFSESLVKRLASFVFESDIPVADIDEHGNMLYANPAMTNLLLQYGFNDQGSPSIMPLNLYNLIEIAIQKKEVIRHIPNALEEICFVWNLYPENNMGHKFVKVIGSDVTDLNKTRAELRKAKEGAEAASKAKSLFLANMSHELRTPMNAILGFADLGLRFDNVVKKNQFFQKIKTSGQALLEIINDILDFSKIEAGKLTIEKIAFDPREHVEMMCDLFSEISAEKKIEFVLYFDPAIPNTLMGDPLRFRQALINLISNAMKFTAKGEVLVSVEFKKLVGDQVCLYCSVRDSGTGIPKDSIPNLFQSFTQLDESTTRRFGGTGLGLSITKSLVEIMNGQIGVDSTPGEGSDFYFSAWFGVQPDAISNYYEKSLAVLSGVSILIIEDHAPTQNNLRKMMIAYGLDPDILSKKELIARDFSYFSNKISRYSAILCSSREESWHMMRKLFSHVQTPEKNWPPIVLLRYPNDLSRREAFSLPIKFYLDKPIKHSELIDLLVRVKTNLEKASPTPMQAHEDPFQGVKTVLKNKKFLVVDDNAFNQELIIEILKDAQIDYDVADNGKEALEKICAFKFTGVFMDLHMPVMDGFETTERIRLIPGLVKMPIIGLTADIQEATREKCLSAGMTSFLTKPYSVRSLFKALSDIYEGMPPESVNENISAAQESSSKEKITSTIYTSATSSTQKNPLKEIDNDVLNIDHALNMLGGKVPLLLKLARLFVKDFSDVSIRLKEAIDKQDFIHAQRIVHTTKGSAGNLAAQKLVKASAEIENSLKGQNFQVENLLDSFDEAVSEVLFSLEEMIKKTPGNPS